MYKRFLLPLLSLASSIRMKSQGADCNTTMYFSCTGGLQMAPACLVGHKMANVVGLVICLLVRRNPQGRPWAGRASWRGW